jgi:TolB-like protein/pimeloyl-ACP methyl ester carboxylesterase
VLSLRFLGEPRIERDGAALELPPSKKTRALLAYLAVTGRPHRRERLCSLLWEVPDDPRGALRWSLSKIRGLVDEPGQPRIVADRETVRFDPQGAQIDVLDLRRLSAGGFESMTTDALASLADAFGGDFLEGLELPESHDFHAWCIAEREEARALRVRILSTLVERLKASPEQALPHARALVGVESHDEAVWAIFVRLLAAAGRRREAEDQCELGRRVLQEAGTGPAGPLLKVMRNLRKSEGRPPDRPAVAADAPPVLPSESAGHRGLRVAVLPFADPGADSGQQYFGDGIAADIITELARYGTLIVIARNSSFRFRLPAVDMAAVRRDLGADFVVAGNIRKAGARVRVSAQLIDTHSESQVWADNYDREIADIFDVQDELVQAIVMTLEGRIAASGAARARRKPTTDLLAYDLLLQGRELGARYRFDEAEPLLRRAVELDPGYVQAHAWLANALIARYWHEERAELLQEALACAQRAVSLDDNDAWAQQAMGIVLQYLGQFDRAGLHFERALSLNPNDVFIVTDHAHWLMCTGRPADALERLEVVLKRDPFPPAWTWDVQACSLFHLQRHGEAIAAFQKMSAMPPVSRLHLAAAYALAGHPDCARREVKQVLDLRPEASLEQLGDLGLSTESQRRHLIDGLREAGFPGGRSSRGATAVRQEDGQQAPIAQDIRYCLSADGVRLAYACVGNGPPLVKTANWLTHLEYDWESPVWRHWMRELSRDRCLVRYDQRGNGLSHWDVADLSFDALVRDLETVVDAAGIERFALLGLSLGSAVAIAYAARHPDRLTHLVLFGGYARGWALRGSPEEIAQRRALRTLIEHGWGQDNPAFRQVFTSRFIPEATAEQMRWMNELQRMTTSPENALRLDQMASTIDVRDLLPQLRVPTLVIHCREDGVVPFAEGERLADSIPEASFIPLEGRNHIILESEPGWPAFVAALRTFLAEHGPAPVRRRPSLDAPRSDIDRWDFAFAEATRLPSPRGPTMMPAAGRAEQGMRKPTLAVLPFRSLGAPPGKDFLADGITEDLTTTLSRMLGLFVIARDSAFLFQDQSIGIGATEAARRLGVQYALHGSVRTAGDRMRVNAYLMDADGSAEIWSERYDVPLEDVFAVQDQITTNVVRALQVELLEGEQARVWHRSTQSVEAWSCLTQGLTQYKRQTRDGVHRARALFERATEIDPGYAAAWAWLAYAHWHDARFLWVDDPEAALAQAGEIAERALALDANLSEVHAVLAAIRVLRQQYDEAVAAARMAVKLNPNGAEATALLAFVLIWAGYPEEALRTAERAIRFCPLHSPWYLDTLAHAQRLLRQFDRALVSYQQAIIHLPDYIMPHIGLAICYAEMGRLLEAREQAREVLRIDPAFSITKHTRLNAYRLPEHSQRRLDALRAAGLPD